MDHAGRAAHPVPQHHASCDVTDSGNPRDDRDAASGRHRHSDLERGFHPANEAPSSVVHPDFEQHRRHARRHRVTESRRRPEPAEQRGDVIERVREEVRRWPYLHRRSGDPVHAGVETQGLLILALSRLQASNPERFEVSKLLRSAKETAFRLG